MAEATDIQMQTYCDQRVRVFAEQARALYLSAKDHKAAIDDIYSRAAGTNRWNDSRSDGPPHLLQAGNSANPDDALNFNAFLSSLITFFEATEAANWAVLQRACVRPV